MKRIVIACDGTWSRLDAPLSDQRRQARPGGAARRARTAWRRSPATSTASAPGAAPGGLRAPPTGCSAALLGEGLMATHRGSLPLPGLHLCARRRDPSLRLLARRLHRALARGADPQLRHPRARAMPRRSRRRWRSTAPARRETGPDSAAARAFRARMRRTSPPAPARRPGARARGLPAGAPLGSPTSGSGTPSARSGCPATWRWRGWLNRGLAFHDTALSGMVAAARHAVAIDERRRTFPPTLWDNLDALNAARPAAPTRSAGFPATTARSAAAARSPRSPTTRCSGSPRARPRPGWRSTRRRSRPGGGAATAADRCARRRRSLRRLLALDPATAPARRGSPSSAEPRSRRWRADPGYRPRALARVAAALGGAPAAANGAPAPADGLAPAANLLRRREARRAGRAFERHFLQTGAPTASGSWSSSATSPSRRSTGSCSAATSGSTRPQALLEAQRLAWGYGAQPPLYDWLQWGVFQALGDRCWRCRS